MKGREDQGLTRRALFGALAGLGAAAAGLGGPEAAWGQQHGGHGPEDAGQGHRLAEACAEQFQKVVEEGRGFGMAFAADRNGYPGPTHILELKTQLRLTADQERKAEALLHAMLAESRPKGARLLEAERRLERLYADGVADESSVRAGVAEVERARSEVRLVHLLTHLRARDLLTREQRDAYHKIRWGMTTG
jgi:Spy/CpxP family protein refolding chaperone